MQFDDDKTGMSPLVKLATEAGQANVDARSAEIMAQIHALDQTAGNPAALPRLIDAIASPAELQRTSVRIMLNVLHRGIGKTSVHIRRLPEARQLSDALYAASDFFNANYDPAQCSGELRKLCDALVAFSNATKGSDPWTLSLYAMGDLKASKRRQDESTVVPLRP